MFFEFIEVYGLYQKIIYYGLQSSFYLPLSLNLFRFNKTSCHLILHALSLLIFSSIFDRLATCNIFLVNFILGCSVDGIRCLLLARSWPPMNIYFSLIIFHIY